MDEAARIVEKDGVDEENDKSEALTVREMSNGKRSGGDVDSEGDGWWRRLR